MKCRHVCGLSLDWSNEVSSENLTDESLSLWS
jgi:hypothetical protein